MPGQRASRGLERATNGAALKSILQEIHDRSLWQVLGIYLAGSWLALQVVDTLNSTLGMPEWVIRTTFVLLLIGLPIIMITAFVQRGWRGRVDGGVDTTPVARSRHLWSWRNALLGGVGAFALLGVGTAAWLIMRTAGIGPAGTLVAKGVLEDRSFVILSDFESDDEALGRAATEAFRVDLSQSNVIRLADAGLIRDARARMELEPEAALDLELARELAEREGMAAVIGGEINAAGGRYLLSASIVTPASGEVLTSQRETAKDSSDIIPAIDRLSRKVRERTGESLRTIGSSPPLERVTTDNLEALRQFSQGIRLTHALGPNDRSRAFFEEAVAIDTAFASAWRAIGIDLRNTNQERARMVEALARAVAHEDRLTEAERYRARGIYFETVTGEPEKTVREYEKLLEIEPDNVSALIGNGVAYANLRDFERSAEYFQRARDAHPDVWLSHYNLVEALSDLGRFEEAEAVLDSARVIFGGSSAVLWTTSQLAATRQAYREAEALHTAQWEDSKSSLVFRALLASDLASMVAVQGRLAEADGFITDAMDANESRGVGGEYIEDAIQGAWIDLAVRLDPSAALTRVEAALERVPLEDMNALDRPYLELAELFAAAGDPVRARTLLEWFDAEVPVELRGGMEPDLDRAAAEIALAEGDHAAAIELFERSDQGYCLVCPFHGLARAYEASGQPDSAIVSLEEYVNSTWFLRFYGEEYGLGALLGPSLERLAQLYDEADDPENAAPYYARFVELWEDADPQLQPRVQAARRRLEQIIDARG